MDKDTSKISNVLCCLITQLLDVVISICDDYILEVTNSSVKVTFNNANDCLAFIRKFDTFPDEMVVVNRYEISLIYNIDST